MAINDIQQQTVDWVALRHGETTAGQCYLGRTDATLTEKGWRQMSNAFGCEDVRSTQQVDSEFGDLIITSPLARCHQFAKVLAQSLKINCYVEPYLQEFDFGEWDGRTAADILEADKIRLEAFWADPVKYPPPQGETLALFSERLKKGLDEIAHHIHQGHKPIVITHGGVIKALRCLQQGWSFDKMWQIPVEHGSLHPFTLD
jgi:alpha-ribazole phosphatase